MKPSPNLQKYWINSSISPSPRDQLTNSNLISPKNRQSTYSREGTPRYRPDVTNTFSQVFQKRENDSLRSSPISKFMNTPRNESPLADLKPIRSTPTYNLQTILPSPKGKEEFGFFGQQSDSKRKKSTKEMEKRKSCLKDLSGKMLATELWGKKQQLQFSHMSSTAALFEAGIKDQESPIALKLNSQREISSRLFSKYQNDIKLSSEDVSVELPLYDQIIVKKELSSSTMLHQPSSPKILRRDSMNSLKDASPISNDDDNSRNNSQDPQESRSVNRTPLSPRTFRVTRNGLGLNSRLVKSKIIKTENRQDKQKNSLSDINNSMKQTTDVSEIDEPNIEKKSQKSPKHHQFLLKLTKKSTKDDYYPSDYSQKQTSFGLTDRINRDGKSSESARGSGSLLTLSPRDSNHILESRIHLDFIIDECDQFAKDRSYNKVLSKMEELTDPGYELFNKRKEKKAETLKQEIIDRYAGRVQNQAKRNL